MKRKTLLFLLVAAAQLAVPAFMLIGHERVRNEGAIFNFRTAPVDPRDPFRGEYVRLDFEVENGRWILPLLDKDGMPRVQHAFAVLGADSAGFARIDALVDERPSAGAFVPVEYMYWSGDTLFNLDLPFDRFYVQEGDGPRTEELLAPQWNDTTVTPGLPAYAVVRVLDGQTVIEDLIVGDRSIQAWMDEEVVDKP